ncbi:hypothetical protein [Chitinimonas koreensis]|uniref:hypothetical protein n=1 Tax=Chitinimonas koreensis TaxID=356302 RepID=UPI000412AFCE|nr:hypothetical protein [Chitinimonas koreensis]QNM97981.1 hypothetical protein H9L41_06910 [Chitinimonas koreensis]
MLDRILAHLQPGHRLPAATAPDCCVLPQPDAEPHPRDHVARLRAELGLPLL